MNKLSTGLFALALVAAMPQAQASDEGQKVFNRSCKMCHGTGMMGAPKIGDKSAWKPRIEARDKKTMIEGTIKGFGKMMPRGGCRACSDEDIAAAVEYLLSQAED